MSAPLYFARAHELYELRTTLANRSSNIRAERWAIDTSRRMDELQRPTTTTTVVVSQSRAHSHGIMMSDQEATTHFEARRIGSQRAHITTRKKTSRFVPSMALQLLTSHLLSAWLLHSHIRRAREESMSIGAGEVAVGRDARCLVMHVRTALVVEAPSVLEQRTHVIY